MSKRIINSSVNVKLIIIALLSVKLCLSQTIGKRLCADAECTSPISNAMVQLKYVSSGPHMLTVPASETVKVFSKEKDGWNVEYNGQRGYVPVHILRETRIIVKKEALIEVNSELAALKAAPKPAVDNVATPTPVVPVTEIIDGTVIVNEPVARQETAAPSTPVANTENEEESEYYDDDEEYEDDEDAEDEDGDEILEDMKKEIVFESVEEALAKVPPGFKLSSIETLTEPGKAENTGSAPTPPIPEVQKLNEEKIVDPIEVLVPETAQSNIVPDTTEETREPNPIESESQQIESVIPNQLPTSPLAGIETNEPLGKIPAKVDLPSLSEAQNAVPSIADPSKVEPVITPASPTVSETTEAKNNVPSIADPTRVEPVITPASPSVLEISEVQNTAPIIAAPTKAEPVVTPAIPTVSETTEAQNNVPSIADPTRVEPVITHASPTVPETQPDAQTADLPLSTITTPAIIETPSSVTTESPELNEIPPPPTQSSSDDVETESTTPIPYDTSTVAPVQTGETTASQLPASVSTEEQQQQPTQNNEAVLVKSDDEKHNSSMDNDDKLEKVPVVDAVKEEEQNTDVPNTIEEAPRVPAADVPILPLETQTPEVSIDNGHAIADNSTEEDVFEPHQQIPQQSSTIHLKPTYPTPPPPLMMFQQNKNIVEETPKFENPPSVEQSSSVETIPELLVPPQFEGTIEEITTPSPVPPIDQSNYVPVPPTPELLVEEEALAETTADDSPGFFAGLFGFFSKSEDSQTIDEPAATIDPITGQINDDFNENLNHILNLDIASDKTETISKIVVDDGHCDNLSPDSPCPVKQFTDGIKHPLVSNQQQQHHNLHHAETVSKITEFLSLKNYDELADIIVTSLFEMKDLIVLLSITAITVLVFALGYYCINKCRKESPLISNLNALERHLMVSRKECTLLKAEIEETRGKLASIEDNSFGSNDMVIALKDQLKELGDEKEEQHHQITTLEKELENAAEAGLELNRMVSELLNNQSGSDSIINSVEELQKELNEQEKTIISINSLLAEKSRENSELQILLAEQKSTFDEQLNEIQQSYSETDEKSSALEEELREVRNNFETKLTDVVRDKNAELERLQKEITAISHSYDETEQKFQRSETKNKTLDQYLRKLKDKTGVNQEMREALDTVHIKAELNAVTKENEQMRERVESELDAKKLLEDRVKSLSEEVSSLKQDHSTSDKEKVEAQTRLDVLSAYFKEKETQLQKELSIKEAMWMQSQGETTTTVERIRLMQDEIQTLKSQNESLRAEIEAQSTAHKLQLTTLDSRAHEAWLSTRQAERRLEETRVEAAGLRRKLTSFAEGNTNGIDSVNAPSPIHMIDNSGSPILMAGLPPPQFMPPFMAAPPPPFMPPPFMPGEMRPPPLGRLMSPPPNRYSPGIVDDRDRYSPERGSGRYTPESRYNYNDTMSPYETETDFSPPPSPGPHRGGGRDYRDNRRGSGGGYKAYSSPPPPSDIRDRNKKLKGGHLSPSSADSINRRGGGSNGGSASKV